LACAAIIRLVSDALAATIALVMGMAKAPAQTGKGEPMKVASEKAGSGEKASTEKSKKEL
jgi:hypothetical protein